MVPCIMWIKYKITKRTVSTDFKIPELKKIKWIDKYI